jgi:peptidoglycan/LPS O-acetylase OafA/YrhL
MSKNNNFDLIRLAAALQVAIQHSATHLHVGSASLVSRIVDLFPGVPIFFFISGFLISKSYEKNPRLAEFARNRALRVYPGMYMCLLVSLTLVWLSGCLDRITVSPLQVIGWLCAQLSIAQFYNPDFLRGYGVGVLNGSLWTISVELQFYVVLPVMYLLLRLQRIPRRTGNVALGTLALVFLLVNQLYAHGVALNTDGLAYKLVGVTFAPWLYMFLCGVLAQRNSPALQRVLGGRFMLVCGMYVAVGLPLTIMAGWQLGNSLNPILFAGVCSVVFVTAFSALGLSDRVLGRNDISYGVYIYHMPVVNFLLARGYGGGLAARPLALALTLVLAFFSWRWIEKPALRLKRHPLYDHEVAPGSGSPAT